MTLLDSNIVIYAARPERADLRQWIAGRVPAVSAVTVVEALGYHRLAEAERVHLEAFFAAASVLPISELVVQQAVALRQSRRMSLGDSLIGATAFPSVGTRDS